MFGGAADGGAADGVLRCAAKLWRFEPATGTWANLTTAGPHWPASRCGGAAAAAPATAGDAAVMVAGGVRGGRTPAGSSFGWWWADTPALQQDAWRLQIRPAPVAAAQAV
jgi:hypothetical protein